MRSNDEAIANNAANWTPQESVQCDNCGKMFDPDDDDCFIGWHVSFGDCCQCAKCVHAARANFPF